ncbi:hypothetical protein SBOR_7239 [Sclerotinia borealis F-4128]|uniref:Dihydroneopterin aldolase/epimerase domain-containing protein n=1 Tax=Sclerotinia borealis (strain F-4128) TaxID=1432307 RepID=W9CC25_SCLBF|nr:hypothetical protein SBOR_7239 [Sclerotinia borealis F-4128]
METQVDPSDTSEIPSEIHPSGLDMCMNKTLWELSKGREEPVAVIGIKNLQFTLPVGAGAWSWEGNIADCPAQPVLVSMSVSLRQPFKTASKGDDITDDTIHYGRLRSGIIQSVENYKSRLPDPHDKLGILLLSSSIIHHFTFEDQLAIGKHITWSSFKIMLPKVSLHGAGISLTSEMIYKMPPLKEQLPDVEAGRIHTNGLWGRSSTLRVHDLTVSTIIGMLEKERIRKQKVVANVEIDRWHWLGDDHWDMEQIILKTIEESTFKTLEALAEHICKRVARYFLIPMIVKRLRIDSAKYANKWEIFDDDYTKNPWEETIVSYLCPFIKIKLEKPGIYLDTTPGVEMTMDIRPSPRSPYFYLWKGYKTLKIPDRPFEGTLKDWIAKNDPEDLDDREDPAKLHLQRKFEAFQAEVAEARRITEEINSHASASSSKPSLPSIKREPSSPRIKREQE